MTPLTLSLLLLLVKSLCVFALAGLTLLALRRASAASRHLVCLLTLAALLALPLFSWTPLSLPVSVPMGGPLAPNSGGTRVSDLTPRPHLPQGEGAGVEGTAPVGAKGGPQTEAGGRGNPAPTPAVSAPSSPAPHYWGGGAFLLALWLLGVLLAAVRPLLGLWGIGRLNRSSRAETDPTALTLAADCAALLCLSRAPAVRRGDVPVPITWGLHRPVVLLPDAADTWPDGRLRAVLLHELAHIRRRDWAAHRLADLTCALYWFHPLVWLFARRLRDESELACDDLVLSCGIPAPDYARHLLDIARALSPAAPPAPTGAIGMARTAHVEERITQMLNPTQNRRAVTRRTVFAALLAAALGVGSLAALKPEAQAQVPSNPKPIQPQSAKTPSEIIGITNAAMPEQGWWDKDGKPIPAPAFSAGLSLSDRHITTKPGERPLFIAFRYLPASKEILHLADISGETQNGLTMSEIAMNPRRRTLVKAQSISIGLPFNTVVEGAAFPVSLQHTKIRTGTPSPQWTPALVVHYGLRGDIPTFTIAEDHYGTIDIFSDKIKYSLPLKEPGDFYDLRLMAVDKHGRQALLPALKTESHGSREEITVSAPHTSSQLQEIRVEAKPFIWTVYNNVALQPTQAEAQP